jgi:hypothetical protein
MKLLPDKKAVWITSLVCAVLLILLTWRGVFRGFGSAIAWGEQSEPQQKAGSIILLLIDQDDAV